MEDVCSVVVASEKRKALNARAIQDYSVNEYSVRVGHHSQGEFPTMIEDLKSIQEGIII